MKLLLTSAGYKNDSIITALKNLLTADIKQTKLVFIPTAANVERGNKEWLITDLHRCIELGFQEVDIVDIAAVPQHVWLPPLEAADVIMVGGGNAYYLMDQMRKSGLADMLPEILKNRVYVGVSAGSMVMAPKLKEEVLHVIYDEVFEGASNEGLGLVDFLVVPHLNSPYFPRTAEMIDEVAKRINTPLYVIDDESAVQVVDGKAEVVTEGRWKRYN
ncbi:MAG TPA: Type 1 glutamine amidotransferase-like domain-containing protein [Candidatus Andersenbacteria bacterium]|nr:Type 1 glutamine amidotransferase-like domain-containing protein [Candidatus Andersenbacteria bacterium]